MYQGLPSDWRLQISVTGLSCPPPNSYVEALTLRTAGMTKIGVFKEAVKLKEVMWVGSNPM